MGPLTPDIVISQERKFVGKKIDMSLRDNKTSVVWQSFMPMRHTIKNHVNDDLISMRVYSEPLRAGDIDQKFEKWAVIEVSNFIDVPGGMEIFTLEKGLYAVFHYKGLSTDSGVFRYIYGEWLLHSDYDLDLGPHFEVLGSYYKNGDPESEEDIWIPIVKKGL